MAAGDARLFPTGWLELCESSRVVVLAEAGSGKTWEMRAQAARLVAEGKPAFFIPIEVLADEDLRDYLAMAPGEAERFDAWLETEGDPAWFFLDAVDELKLAAGKLDLALGKVTRALGPARDRARVVLSCRPTDWRPVDDLQSFQKRLPVPQPAGAASTGSDDDFLAGMREKSSSAEVAKAEALRLVVLVGLGTSQIRKYVEAMGVKNADGFLHAVDQHDAWSFATRPLDLEAIAKSWDATGRLGTRLEQHQLDVSQSLRDKPDRVETDDLSLDRATDGAERLALSLALMRRRTVRVPERSDQDPYDTTSVDPTAVLRDWTDREIGALLRRPIFDPATYGRVRFHHRSIQEFLAARRLLKLRDLGMPARQLRRLLFGELYGERVVIPSMRAIAAWLALWDHDIQRELLDREPEALILHGDPETLAYPARVALLQAYVSAYGDGTWRGLEMPITEIRRLALPDLAAELRACWNEPHTNEEIEQFLLKVIWQGKICECADLAEAVAFDEAREIYTRALALRILDDCRPPNVLEKVVADLMQRPAAWPPKLVFAAAGVLFPAALSLDGLLTLVKRTPEPSGTVDGFAWALYTIAEEMPDGPMVEALRDAVAALVFDGWDTDSAYYQLRSRFTYLSGSLLRLCARSIRQGGTVDARLAIASVIGHRFGHDETLGDDDGRAVAKLVAQAGSQRRAFFDADLDVLDKIAHAAGAEERLFYTHRYGGLVSLAAHDWDWMLVGLSEQQDAFRREVYFRALVDLWRERGKVEAELQLLRQAAAGEAALLKLLEQSQIPHQPPPEWEQHERDMAERRVKRDADHAKRDQSWLDWRKKIETDPDKAFSDEQRDGTLHIAVKWLGTRPARDGVGRTAWRELRPFFSPGVVKRFEDGLKRYWREHTPAVNSRRPRTEHNMTTLGMSTALTGLLIEASEERWPGGLSEAEAQTAAGWATLEMGRFPEWFEALATARGEQVRGVLETELGPELDAAATLHHPPILGDIQYGGDVTRQIVAPYLRERLLGWPALTEDDSSTYVSNLDRVLTILSKAGSLDAEIAAFCEARFLADPLGDAGTIWLQGLCACDLRRGLEAIRTVLGGLSDDQREAVGVRWLAALFGDRDYSRVPVPIEGEADLLVDLTRLAYQLIRREDDVEHEGIYTPGARDNAEGARNRLLTLLINQPGPGAHAALLRLATEPLFAHLKDRLRLMARERAAQDSEPPPVTADDLRDLEQRYEMPPRTRDQLFDTMMDRLSDIADALRHDEFNERHILLPVQDEKALQPVFARKLRETERNAYRTDREGEVADQKKTDIQLFATAFSGRAVIEIKVAENSNTVATLQKAIKDQLLGRYLRSADCKAGCLLVTCHSGKTYRTGGVTLDFSQLIQHLQAYSAELQAAERGAVRLGVMGIDLRPPTLVSL